jgi:outer membrane receptor protein involved in Fe transport
MLKRIALLFVCTLLAGSFLFSQITTSSITGSVKDSVLDAPLVGATITATHLPTGTKYVAISVSGGRFSMPDLRPGGPYLIEISFVGFETHRFEDVYLKLAEPYLLNAQMTKAEGALENVIVTTATARNQLFTANRMGATTNIGRRDIERMPSISRSVNDLTRIAPQANGNQIAGGNYRQNNFTIDGAYFNNSFGIGSNLPANGSPISLDAIDEISVNISPYDIRQSGFIGGAINAVTRSGTNNFSGSVYEYWRNEKQEGGKVGNVSFTRTPFSFNQKGIRLGGPIIKDKLFFFFNFETDNQPYQVQTRFASTSAAPYGSSSNIARPTADSLNIIRNYLYTKYKYDTGPFDNYSTEISHKKYLGRLDWNIAKNHHLMIRYSQVEGGSPSAPSGSRGGTGFQYPFGQGITDINALWFANNNYFQGSNFYSFAAELTSHFGRKFSNILRGTYTYQNDSRNSGSTIFPDVDILSGGLPYTTFGYEAFTYGNLRKVKLYSFIDNLSWTTNKHNWTVGMQADFSQTINGFMRFGTSYYQFNSWNDFISGANPANFAVTFSLLPGYKQAFPSFKFAQFGYYAQDEISVNDKLRLTVGLRVDQPVYRNVEEIQTNPYILAATFANGVKLNTGVLPKRTLMWSPRIGFNYDLYGNRSLQIRGGTGIFTGNVPFVWIVSQSGDAGMLQTTLAINGQSNTPGPFNPDPMAYLPATQPKAGVFIPSTTDALAPNFKFPQTWKSSLAMDTKLPWGTTFTLEAIFNKDLNTPYFQNVNLVTPSALNVAGYPDNRKIYPNSNNQKFINPLKVTSSTSTIDPTGTAAFNAIQLTNGNKGMYFSISAQLQKQFSKGFSAYLSYTKTLNSNLFDGSGDQPYSAWTITPTNSLNGTNSADLGYASYSIPDNLSAGFTLRKEYFKHLATTISLVYHGSIDGRFSYTYSGDFNRDGVNGNDLIYIPKNPSDITFVSKTYSNGVTYTPQQQSDLFFSYISQDKYLSKHMGQYAERNGGQYPWRNEVDVKFLQDLFVNLGKYRNTIQFSLDIFNFGNLLNSNWGKSRIVNTPSVLTVTNISSYSPGGTTKPTFTLTQDPVSGGPVTQTFRDNVSIFSTYYMQFGLRYLFGN